jgi:hypothetical protein
LDDVLRDNDAVWQQFSAALQALPEPDLIQPGRFGWLGKEALGFYAMDSFLRHLHEEHKPDIHSWLVQLDAKKKA